MPAPIPKSLPLMEAVSIEEVPGNVAAALPQVAASRPHDIAVKVPLPRRRGLGRLRYTARTFAELEDDTNRLARALQARGIVRGTRVLVLVRPGLDLIRLVFALFKLGAPPVVIDPGMGRKGFLECVRRAGPEVMVAIPAAHWIARLFPQSFASVGTRLTVSPKATARLLAEAPAEVFEPVEPADDELAAILFTSGSTGPAKGVCYTHAHFAAQVALLQRAFAIEPGEIDLPMLPVFALFNPALGATTVVPEMNPSRPAKAPPARLVQAIRQEKVTTSFGSPVLWRNVARYCRRTKRTLPSLKHLLIAGAPVPAGLLRELAEVAPQARVYTPYGATEALPLTAMAAEEILSETAARSEQGEGTCVGRPLPGIELRVIAPAETAIPRLEDATGLSPGAVGEVLACGPVVTARYDALPEATTAAKIQAADGRLWHRMGDAGWLDERGRLWFCGRVVEAVHTADGPLYTERVEAVVNTHPRVRRSALIGLGEAPAQVPAIVVEPERWPHTSRARAKLVAEVLAFARKHPASARLEQVFVQKHFPVDVRHNAKIHRLRLAREWNAKR